MANGDDCYDGNYGGGDGDEDGQLLLLLRSGDAAGDNGAAGVPERRQQPQRQHSFSDREWRR